MTPAARTAGILPKSRREAMGADRFKNQETTT
jgi:hypothetical protein